MKLYQNLVLAAYALTLILFGLYSYALVDPNLTLVNSSLWASFRDTMVQFGYYQRPTSSIVYIGFVLILFGFHWYFVKKYKSVPVRFFAVLFALLAIVSYPFLSHDFFNYLFDAKIATFYHKNPYLYKGLDFPGDPWLRFMHWTHRTYPYGPSFLLISLIPSFFGFGKFLLHFVLFKGMFFAAYAVSVFFLLKMNKKWAVFFATQPLIIIEGLISSHNDLLAVAFAIMGIYLVREKKKMWSGVLFVLSVGIKYLSLPVVLLFVKRKEFHIAAFIGAIGVLAYMTIRMEIQPWYFLLLLIFLPYFEHQIYSLFIFFAGLLFSYYPYVRFGGWDEPWKVQMKHEIIAVFAVINLIYYLYVRFILSKKKFFTK